MAAGPVDVNVLLLDLDNTLYDPACGLLSAGDQLITQFIACRLGLPEDEADRLRTRTWREYGATARGLEVEFGIPQREFFAGSIERCPINEYVRPWPELAVMLARLPQRALVFTNATEAYARRVLERLGVADLIERIFDIEFMDGRPKPERAGYERLLQELGMPARRVALVDDTEANLAPAAELGMVTIRLGGDAPAPPHLHLPDLLDLPRLLGL
jgi:putative hydrolase of the HAD superfamily